MGNVLILGFCALFIGSCAWMMIRADEAKDSTLLREINELKGKYSKLQTQVNEMNTKVYESSERISSFERAALNDFDRLNKQVRELDFNISKPRAVNVTLMKPVEVRDVTQPKIREVVRKKSRVRKKKASKKVTKKKSKKKSSKK